MVSINILPALHQAFNIFSFLFNLHYFIFFIPYSTEILLLLYFSTSWLIEVAPFVSQVFSFSVYNACPTPTFQCYNFTHSGFYSVYQPFPHNISTLIHFKLFKRLPKTSPKQHITRSNSPNPPKCYAKNGKTLTFSANISGQTKVNTFCRSNFTNEDDVCGYC